TAVSFESGLLICHPALHVLVDTLVEMKLRFLGEVFVEIRTEHRAAQTAKPTHDMLPALGKTQNFANRFGQAVPLGLFFSQTFLSGSSETVDPGSPILLGDPPFGGDPARLLHTVKRRVKRPFLDAQ